MEIDQERLEPKRTIAILISGKAGVGKSTLATLLTNYLENRYKRIKVGIFPFATQVKKTALIMGWDGVKDQKGRKLLQQIGQTGRAYYEDIWVRATIEGIEDNPKYPLDVILVDDWRFPKEAKFVSNSPLYTLVRVRIDAPERELLKGTPEYLESSENSLPEGKNGLLINYDYVIYNNESLENLKVMAAQLWEFILEIKKENMEWN